MKKDWYSLITDEQTSPHVKEKQVKFSDNDDIMFIYPWSPTKFLLFGKYTEEEIRQRRRSKLDQDHPVAPILKKSRQRQLDHSVESVELLQDILLEETFPRQPILPNMAIFSPNEQKDLITNNQKLTAPTLKPVKKKKKLKKGQLNSNFTLIGQPLRTSHNNGLPLLPAKTLNEALFGSVKIAEENDRHTSLTYVKMPLIFKQDEFNTPVRKPLIKTQISQRYSLISDSLDDIQHLCEEKFYTETGTSKKVRRPLPEIPDNCGRTYNSAPVNTNRKTFKENAKTPWCNNGRLSISPVKSCKQEVQLLEARLRKPETSNIIFNISKK